MGTSGTNIAKTRKDVIIEEAAILIREKGYVAATMRDIAAKVGIEAASLYNHIQSKQHILHEICFKLADQYTTKMSRIDSSEESAIVKLKQLIELHIDINTKYSALSTVMNDEWRHLKEPHLSRFLELRNSYERKFLRIIYEGKEQGELRDINPKVAMYSILGSIRWLQNWYSPGKQPGLEEIKHSITELLLGGIINK